MARIKIYGKQDPVVGVKEYYSILDFFENSALIQSTQPQFKSECDDQIKWSIWILVGSSWIKMSKNNKTGATVNYTFSQDSLTRKGIRMLVETNGEKAILDIKSQKATESKILFAELLDANYNKPTRPFAYCDKMIARVHCVNMERYPLTATLWEDDGGKNKKNSPDLKIDIQKGNVLNGVMDVTFYLNPKFSWLANAKFAPNDRNEGTFHEYYVTAEFFEKISKPSSDVNVINLDYKEDIHPAPHKKLPESHHVAPHSKKQTPAEKKGLSKKEEKGIVKSDKKVYDYHEQKVFVKNQISSNPIQDIINSMMTVNIGGVWEPKKDNKNGICEAEARVRAFMRMLRKGEGTQGESGYTKQFGGGSFSDMSNHPQKIIHSGNYYSSAAGAYQIMGYTYYWLNGEKLDGNNKKVGIYEQDHDYIKKYNVKDFKNESQDKLCLIILKHKRRGSLDLIIKNKIKEALEKYGSYEWASLPPGRYGQPTKTMDGALKEYERCLKEELAGKTILYLKKGFLKEFGYNCCNDDDESNDTANCKSCKKKHIDLSDKVKWQSQYDSKWGDKISQDKACKKTCDDILIKNGLKATSLLRLFQTAIENDTHTKLIIDKEVSKKAVDYLDNELDKGNPVQVGVDHDLNYKINNNADHSTDHFIVIIGRGCDDGKIYYPFYDVGTSFEKKGASENNRLYLDTSDNSLKGKTVYNGNFYTVTQIRKN